MKKELYLASIDIPTGINCSFNGITLECSKNSVSLRRKIDDPKINVAIADGKITFSSSKPDKRSRKIVQAYIAHINNLFTGLDSRYTYRLEACNVHFPMTLKVEKESLLINNFLGEKTPRKAVILPNVEVQIKGAQITVASHDKEAAGQTAANFEKATKVRNRDRRVFQDGIYIVDKAGGAA